MHGQRVHSQVLHTTGAVKGRRGTAKQQCVVVRARWQSMKHNRGDAARMVLAMSTACGSCAGGRCTPPLQVATRAVVTTTSPACGQGAQAHYATTRRHPALDYQASTSHRPQTLGQKHTWHTPAAVTRHTTHDTHATRAHSSHNQEHDAACAQEARRVQVHLAAQQQALFSGPRPCPWPPHLGELARPVHQRLLQS